MGINDEDLKKQILVAMVTSRENKNGGQNFKVLRFAKKIGVCGRDTGIKSFFLLARVIVAETVLTAADVIMRGRGWVPITKSQLTKWFISRSRLQNNTPLQKSNNSPRNHD